MTQQINNIPDAQYAPDNDTTVVNDAEMFQQEIERYKQELSDGKEPGKRTFILDKDNDGIAEQRVEISGYQLSLNGREGAVASGLREQFRINENTVDFEAQEGPTVTHERDIVSLFKGGTTKTHHVTREGTVDENGAVTYSAAIHGQDVQDTDQPPINSPQSPVQDNPQASTDDVQEEVDVVPAEEDAGVDEKAEVTPDQEDAGVDEKPEVALDQEDAGVDEKPEVALDQEDAGVDEKAEVAPDQDDAGVNEDVMAAISAAREEADRQRKAFSEDVASFTEPEAAEELRERYSGAERKLQDTQEEAWRMMGDFSGTLPDQ